MSLTKKRNRKKKTTSTPEGLVRRRHRPQRAHRRPMPRGVLLPRRLAADADPVRERHRHPGQPWHELGRPMRPSRPVRPGPQYLLPRPLDAARMASVRTLLLRGRGRAVHQHRRGQERKRRRSFWIHLLFRHAKKRRLSRCFPLFPFLLPPNHSLRTAVRAAPRAPATLRSPAAPEAASTSKHPTETAALVERRASGAARARAQSALALPERRSRPTASRAWSLPGRRSTRTARSSRARATRGELVG